MASNLKRAAWARMAVTGETYEQARAALWGPRLEAALRAGVEKVLKQAKDQRAEAK